METLKARVNNLSLRTFFIFIVFVTFGIVVALSGLTIWGCMAFRRYLLPDSNAAYLTVEQIYEDGKALTTTYLMEFGEEEQSLPRLIAEESPEEGIERLLDAKYSIQKIERGYDTLTPKRKIAYQVCGAAMAAIPAFLSIAGILICGFTFYRRRLSVPLKLLADATEQIAAQNLDFTLAYPCRDEMGGLCRSFEQMREALVQNNRAMWKLLEQRKLLQASVAHDLRNPIAIIEGYTEYLQMNLPGGKLSAEKIQRIVNNLNTAAKRLEYYTESVRSLNQLQDMEIHPRPLSADGMAEDILDNLKMMASGGQIQLEAENLLPACEIQVDSAILCRILENVFGNALRFARHKVSVRFELHSARLQITVTDDGPGFPENVLRKKEKIFLPTQQGDGHLGMGLTISRLLCEKHGGSLKFFNGDSQNAVVKIILAV